MTETITFYKNLHGDLQGSLDSPKWEVVMNEWQKNNYVQSFYSILDYVNPEIRKTFGNASLTEFSIPHGSVIVNISITNSEMLITCPFMNISEAIKLPLLRRVTELNFHPLVLAQIRLKEDKLEFHFSSALQLAEPFKIYEVLREICRYADWYDDEFREKFKAKNLVEPKVTYLPDTESEKAWQQTNSIADETLSIVQYFESQRWYGYASDYLVIGLKRIDLLLQTQGFLKNELETAIENTHSASGGLDKGKDFFSKLKKGGKDALAKNLYQAVTFIPEKWRTNLHHIQQGTEGTISSAEYHHKNLNYIASCNVMHFYIYDLFYKNNLDAHVNETLLQGLAEASGKTWKDASSALLNALKKLTANQA
jgi:hypothetical protein